MLSELFLKHFLDLLFIKKLLTNKDSCKSKFERRSTIKKSILDNLYGLLLFILYTYAYIHMLTYTSKHTELYMGYSKILKIESENWI